MTKLSNYIFSLAYLKMEASSPLLTNNQRPILHVPRPKEIIPNDHFVSAAIWTTWDG